MLAVSSLVAGAGTALWPGVLDGTAVMNGSARGTGLVVALVGVPTLAVSLTLARRGSVAAATVLVGSTAYLTYNAVMLCFATPLNPLFPAYVAMLGSGVLTLAAVVPSLVAAPQALERRLLRLTGALDPDRGRAQRRLWIRQALEATAVGDPDGRARRDRAHHEPGVGAGPGGVAPGDGVAGTGRDRSHPGLPGPGHGRDRLLDPGVGRGRRRPVVGAPGRPQLRVGVH